MSRLGLRPRASDRVPHDSVQSAQDAIEKRIEEAANEQQKSSKPEATTKNRLYALLIGIDEYVFKESNLSGAVRDAERMKSLLLGFNPPVSQERIKFIQNRVATAQRIISEIRSLNTNDEIRKGDPIIIYYAGHGSTIPTPRGWPSGSSHIQCLSPHDANLKKARGTSEVQGVVTDRAFGVLLHDLAEAKGDNITVILDSCHSGGATRDSDSDAPSIARGIEFKEGGKEYTVPASYQEDVWNGPGVSRGHSSSRGLAELPGFAHGGLRSHVILAACGPTEYAYEDRVRGDRGQSVSEGRFTSALIREIAANGPNTMSYTELIRRLGYLSSQTPQCEGHAQDRIIFQSGLSPDRRSHYTVARLGSTCIMRAGQVNGVGPGDTFAVYSTPAASTSRSTQPLGYLRVQTVRAVSSIMSPDFDPQLLDRHPSSIAILTCVGNRTQIHLHVHQGLKRVVAVALSQEVVESEQVPKYTFVVSPKATAVMFLIPAGRDRIAFEILDPEITRHGLKRLDATVPRDADALRPMLHAAAHFFYHLRSSPTRPGLRKVLSGTVQPVIYGLDFSTQTPTPSWLTPGQPVDIQSPKLGAFYPDVFLPDDKAPRTLYGVSVANATPGRGQDLYLWMFYFDCRTLEIRTFYSPPEGSDKVDPSIRASSQTNMPLNYGDAGSQPLAFEMPKERNVDIGFLRIFLSTHKGDLSKIAQGPVVGGRAATHASWTSHQEYWDAITLAVVQRHTVGSQNVRTRGGDNPRVSRGRGDEGRERGGDRARGDGRGRAKPGERGSRSSRGGRGRGVRSER